MSLIGGPLGPVDEGGLTSPPLGPVRRHRSVVVRAGTLGCGEYRATIEPMGGGIALALLRYTGIEYSRTLRGVGELHVTVAGVESCSDQCPDWQSLAAWRHEVVVYRNDDEVARTPLIDPKLKRGEGTLGGGDMASWLEKRLLHVSHIPSAPTDPTLIATSIISDAMSVDARPGLTADYRGLVGVPVVPDLAAYSQHSLDALNSLVDAGLCWTASGRRILVGPDDLYGSEIVATLRDGDWTDSPEVNGSGAVQANTWYVQPDQAAVSEDPDVEAPVVIGAYSDPTAWLDDGVLERLGTDAGVVTTDDAVRVATQRVAITRQTPRVVQGGTLAQDAPITIDKLNPGRLFVLDLATCYPTTQIMRLSGVRVSAAPGKESVAVTFEPTGQAL